jgi:hypothetical protein
MKILDIANTGLKTAAKAVARAVARPRPVDPTARDELRRRADLAARTDAARAEREATLFGSSRWLAWRSNWLGRER